MPVINGFELIFILAILIVVVLIEKKLIDQKIINLYDGLICKILYIITMIVLVFNIGIEKQGFYDVLQCLIWFMCMPLMTMIVMVILYKTYKDKSMKTFKLADIMICVMLIVCSCLTRHYIALVLSVISLLTGLIELITLKKNG